jgi:Spy/CpxP family protein refolding chaperone
MIMRKNSKMKWGLLISSLFFVSVVAMAQPCKGKGPHHDGPGGPMPDSCRAKCMIDNLSKELSLSEDQKQKVTAIHNAHSKEMKVLHEQDSICMAKNKEQHELMRTEMDNEIKKILNDTQKVKFDSIMTEKRGPHKGCPHKE